MTYAQSQQYLASVSFLIMRSLDQMILFFSWGRFIYCVLRMRKLDKLVDYSR